MNGTSKGSQNAQPIPICFKIHLANIAFFAMLLHLKGLCLVTLQSILLRPIVHLFFEYACFFGKLHQIDVYESMSI